MDTTIKIAGHIPAQVNDFVLVPMADSLLIAKIGYPKLKVLALNDTVIISVEKEANNGRMAT